MIGYFPEKAASWDLRFCEPGMQNLKLEAPKTFFPERLYRPTPVKLRRFWCGEIPFLAYQFPNGEIAMSQTQSLPSFSTVFNRIADNFISANGLSTVKATLPNHAIATLYPLPTVMALWNHLLDIGKPLERKELLNAFKAGMPILEDSALLLMKPNDFRVRVEQAPSTLAQAIKLQIEKFSLSILLHSETIYISDDEGLSVIGVPITWLIELNLAQKKARTLKSSGFSFKEELLFYQDVCLFQVKARLWEDWLILWEYFAGKGNTRSLLLLRYLAAQGLERRVASTIGSQLKSNPQSDRG